MAEVHPANCKCNMCVPPSANGAIPSHLTAAQSSALAVAACIIPERAVGMHPALGAGYTNGESILQEAHRLTHGARQKDYGHPLDDYTCTAALVSGLLAHKLKSALTPHEMSLVMVCVKLSREVRNPKRDNRVDGAGYFQVADACLDEALRRGEGAK